MHKLTCNYLTEKIGKLTIDDYHDFQVIAVDILGGNEKVRIENINNKLYEIYCQNIDMLTSRKLSFNKLLLLIRKEMDARYGSVCSMNYWKIRGWTEDEACMKISARQKACTPWKDSEFQRQNGYKLGKKLREDSEFKSSFSHRTLKYWLKNGYSEEEAKIKLKEVQGTTSLGYYIRKYGDNVTARQKYQERCDHYKFLISYDGFKQKFGKDATVKYDEYKLKSNTGSLYLSKTSVEFFIKLFDAIPELHNFKCYHGFKNEFGKFDKKTKKYFFVDFCIPELKIIVEYNGDYWHANPLVYGPDWINTKMKKTATEIWENDKYKKELFESFGFKYFTIWENSRKDNTVNINKLLEEIRNEISLKNSN